MKITKTQLKEIINEELHAALKEREQLQEVESIFSVSSV